MKKTAYTVPLIEVISSNIKETIMLGASDNNGTTSNPEKQEDIEAGESVENGSFSKKFNMWDSWDED